LTNLHTQLVTNEAGEEHLQGGKEVSRHPALLLLPSGKIGVRLVCRGTQERGTKRRCLKPLPTGNGVLPAPAPPLLLSSRIQQPALILKAKRLIELFFQ